VERVLQLDRGGGGGPETYLPLCGEGATTRQGWGEEVLEHINP